MYCKQFVAQNLNASHHFTIYIELKRILVDIVIILGEVRSL